MLIKCDKCGKIFNKIPSKIRKHNFCCNKCRLTFSNKKETFICKVCGKEFKRYKTKVRNNSFCSPECYYNFLKNNGTRKGHKCSAETKEKMRLAALGSKNHCYGKHLTEEHKRKISERQKGKIGYWAGKHRPKEAIKKAVEKLKGHKCSAETKEKIGKANRGKRRTLKQRELMSLLTTSQYLKNDFCPIKYSKQGYFKSIKNKCSLFYRSTYELRAYELLEQDDNVIKYYREPMKIPYFYQGIKRFYIPDILVEFQNGNKMLIEVKAKWAINNKRNIEKFNAARKYAGNNALNFEIWTEKELKIAI